MSVEQAQSLIQSLLSQIPDGVNPWPILRTKLAAEVSPAAPIGMRIQLWLLSALLIVVTLTLLASLVVRYKRGNLVVARVIPTARGKYLTPHYLSIFSIFMVIFLAVLQGYIYKTIAFSNGVTTRDISLWKCLTWAAAWWAFWFATMSLAISHIIHVDASGRPIKSFIAAPFFVNIALFAFPIALLGVTVALSVIANDHYKDALLDYATLDEAVVGAAASYTGTIDTALLAEGVTIVASLLHHIEYFSKSISDVFWSYLAFTLFLQALFTTAALRHIRELRQTIASFDTHAHSVARQQEATLVKTYRALVRITWGIFALLTIFNVIILFVAASGRKTISDVNYSQASSLIGPYLFSILGLPLSFMLLHRALHSEADSATTVGTGSVPAEPHQSIVPHTIANKHNSLDSKEGHEFAMSQLGVGAKVSDGHDNLEGSIDGAPYTKTDTPGSVTSETSETAFVMHQQHEGYQSYSSRPAY